MESKNTGWKILTLLFIALLGTSGFITYDKVLKDKYFTKKENKKETTTKTLPEKTADELYAEYLDNLKEIIDKTYQDMPAGVDEYEFSQTHDALNYGGIDTVCVTDDIEKTESCVGLKDGKLTLTVKESDDVNMNYDIDKNVLQFFVVGEGQGGMHNLYYIKEDGKLYRSGMESLIYENNGSKETNLKNIVGVIPSGFGFLSGSHVAIFIDIEGNLFDLTKGQLNVE